MQRIVRIDESTAPSDTTELLATVKAQLGGVPNIMATLAHSSAALSGYLQFSEALSKGALSTRLREQIALATAGANGCDYCASAHHALGKMAGVESQEMMRNLTGVSNDPRTDAALRFVLRVIETRGHVTDDDLSAVRAATFTDKEIVEIVANTALNIFTNYFNHIADTDIDFPVVSARRAA